MFQDCSHMGYQKSTSLLEVVGEVDGGAGSLARHLPVMCRIIIAAMH